MLFSFAATLSAAGPVVAGTPYTVTLDSTGTSSVASWSLSWGDGTSQTVTSTSDPMTVSHTYSSTGDYSPTAAAHLSGGGTEAAVPLTLDGNFGGTHAGGTQPGVAVTNVTTGADAAYATVIQPNSDVVVAGVSNGNLFEICRYLPNGGLDNGFGTSGKVDINFGGGSTDEAYGLAIDPNGDLVAVGVDNGSFAIARVTSSGALDTTFGSSGLVTTAFSGYTAVATSVAIQPLSSGSYDIVVAGYVDVTSGCYPWGSANFAVARYTYAGALDTTFNSSGKEIISAAPESDHDYAQAIQIQPNATYPTVLSDDDYVIGGYSAAYSSCGSGSPVTQDFALTRLSYSGGTTSFGTGSNWAQTEIGTTDTSGCSGCTGPSIDSDYSLIIQSDGKLISAGSTVVEDNPSSFALARYSANGMLDTTFGSSGIVATPFSSGAVGYGAALETIGSNTYIVVAGYMSGGISGDFAVARYTSSGSLDSTFGSGGQINTDIGGGSDSAQAVAIDPQTGDIIAAGSSTSPGNAAFALVAYRPDNLVHVTLPAPTPLTLTTVSTSEIDLGWTDPSGTSSSIVQQSADGVNWTTIASPTGGCMAL